MLRHLSSAFDPVRFDIVIVGGGLAGASLAVALKNSRYSVALIEGRPPAPLATPIPASWDARIYAVSPGNADFLQEIGIWQHLDTKRITPVYDMDVRGDRGARLDLSAYDAGIAELAWIIEAGLMQRELWETAKRQGNLTLLCPAAPAELNFDTDAARLKLADGRVLEASLIVGADGADSWVREAAGIYPDVTSYGELGVVANFNCAQPHHNTAFQWFRADGVLAYLPLPGQRMSMVWSTPGAHAHELMALDAKALGHRVAEAGDYRLGELALLAPPSAFPLRLMRVKPIVAPRLALIGDAAHAIHPLSGHGINLGYQDARQLAQALIALPDYQDCGDLRPLRRYERSRAEEVALLQWATHGLQRLFRPQQAPLSALRNLGLNLTNRLPVLRNTLVRYALG